jgi:hypothetical protein
MESLIFDGNHKAHNEIQISLSCLRTIPKSRAKQTKQQEAPKPVRALAER